MLILVIVEVYINLNNYIVYGYYVLKIMRYLFDYGYYIFIIKIYINKFGYRMDGKD